MTSLDITKTNPTDGSCTDIHCKCGIWWDQLQQAAYLRLCHHKGGNSYHLEEFYEHRARRIAATYAQIYLESSGNWEKPSLRGRYYWMGLGAFASKVVASVFNSSITKTGYLFGQADSVHVFARGNLWLYMDIAPWHWCWSASPENFQTCKRKRSSDNFTTEQIKKTIQQLPWSDECLEPMGKLTLTSYVERAFELVKDMGSEPFKNRAAQKKHLLELANQEQRRILQKICWNDSDMIEGAEKQRQYRRVMPVSMIFHHDYDRSGNYINSRRFYNFKEEEAYSELPEDKHAEIEDQRMDWIIKVADKYHFMMGRHRDYMEKELGIIAGWANSGSLSDKADGYSNDPN